jgi:hypothetical protein
VAFAAGVWLITRPHLPAAPSSPLVRSTLRAIAAAAVAQSAFTFTAFATGNLTPRVTNAFGVLMTIVEVLSIPFPLLFFVHLRPLAQRLPNHSLARHCAILGPAASLALMAYIGIGQAARLSLWTDPSRFQAWRLPVLVPLLTAGGALVLLYGWSMITLLRFLIGVVSTLRSRRRAPLR